MTELNSDKFLRKITVSEIGSLSDFKISQFRTVRGLQGAETDVFVGVPRHNLRTSSKSQCSAWSCGLSEIWR